MRSEGGPEDGRDYEAEISYDLDTLRGVLEKIDAIALNQDLPLVTRASDAYKPVDAQSLGGVDLDKAIDELSASTIRDIREFEHREGFKEGLQAVVGEISELIEQIEKE